MSQAVGLGLGLGIGAACYLALAIYVWLHRRATGARALVTLLLAVFVWSFCYAFELSSHTIPSARFWSGMKFLGIVVLVPAFWAFITAYSGRRGPLRAPVLVLLSIEPVAVLVLLAVPSLTHLLHTYPTGAAARAHYARAPVAGNGVLFWPHAIYTYVLLLGAVAVLSARLTRVARSYRRQAAALIASTVTPFIGNVVFNLSPASTGRIDPSPFLFLITAAVLVWGFFRLRLLDLVPVARGLVLEQMVDGVLVLDPYGRIVDANPAGAALLGQPRPAVVGRYAVDLLPPVAELMARHLPGRTTRADGTLTLAPVPAAAGQAAVPRGTAAAPGPAVPDPVDVAVSLTSLADPGGKEIGRLLVLTDVTERIATERRLRDLLDEQTRVTQILETSLRPAELPRVPGLRMAARSLPGGRGGVGGDFYDVHPATGEDWAFVLGDVSGKGVRAAVVTSMARYTVRTLSAQGWSPAEVLQQLNQALLEPHDPERFCTAVYGRISATEPAAVRLRLALGGHPEPLVLHRDGTMTPLRLQGTALGLLPDIRVGAGDLDLYPGDLLLAYTDGVTEARRDGEQFGEERLITTMTDTVARLRTGPEQISAGELVEAVANGVLAAVTAFSCDRDDVAVLVLAVEA